MALIISKSVAEKIANDDHGNITEKDVRECFENHCGRYAYDKRPQHLDRHGNPSPWFVAETNHRRKLKIMFVREGSDVELKSAYPATSQVEDLYRRIAKVTGLPG